jgi:tripeptide aminopeptidase
VADLTEVWGEARSFLEEELSEQSQRMRECFRQAAAKFGGQVEAKLKRSFTGFKLSHRELVVQLAQQAVHKIGLRPQLVSSGGGSDANVLNQLGLPTVNLGVGVQKPHTKEETLALADLTAASRLALALATGEEK